MLTTVDARQKFKMLKLPEVITQENTINGGHFNSHHLEHPGHLILSQKG